MTAPRLPLLDRLAAAVLTAAGIAALIAIGALLGIAACAAYLTHTGAIR